MINKDLVKKIFDQLFLYCCKENWQGYDPYDGLNTKLASTFLLKSKWSRISLIQACKRSPINFRPLLGIPKHANPKGHSLAIRALLARANFAKQNNEEFVYFENQASTLLNELNSMYSKNTTGIAWGYPFDWQSRTFFLPRNSPSVVCTTFVAQAYLDAYEYWNKKSFLQTARKACDFILTDIPKTITSQNPITFCLSYIPFQQTQIHNANLLAAALLARVFHHTKEHILCETAIAATRYSTQHQLNNGAWPYGEASNQKWVDSFHTGFNLICLQEIVKYLDTNEWMKPLVQGFDFFCKNFFLEDGCPKYYHNKLYPIDIHAAAQAFVTLTKLQHLNSLAKNHLVNCLSWTLSNLLSPNGYFYFQQTPFFKNRISYLRWSQTWMLYGLSMFLDLHL